ncbi:MAG: PaaI family thioesterase [Acidimicrobiales bacterium]|nr:PaaI family thioesterase [Acidimicrobiales bacterium]MCB1013578.1 PaaI family thioesterase [Acidimicrobiales bacterium]MCB9371890.1 PaaI family thioesterase [Microthrixaceae bacterium]
MTDAADLLAPRAAQHPPLPPDAAELWKHFCVWPGRELYPKLLGFRVEELRRDYCRLRLPYRPELEQPAGPVHGGAIASLIDTVVVPAIGWVFPAVPQMLTLTMSVEYRSALVRADAVAEGWVTQRGRSIVFTEAEVRAADDGRVVANGRLVYKVRPAPDAPDGPDHPRS